MLCKYSHHIVTIFAGFRLLPDNQLEKEREDGTSDLGKQVTLTYLRCMTNFEVEFAFVSEYHDTTVTIREPYILSGAHKNPKSQMIKKSVSNFGTLMQCFHSHFSFLLIPEKAVFSFENGIL